MSERRQNNKGGQYSGRRQNISIDDIVDNDEVKTTPKNKKQDKKKSNVFDKDQKNPMSVAVYPSSHGYNSKERSHGYNSKEKSKKKSEENSPLLDKKPDADEVDSFKLTYPSKSSKHTEEIEKKSIKETVSSERGSSNIGENGNQTNYEIDRLRLKNNVALTIFQLIRGTTGIGYFVIQFELAQVGIWLGFAICAIVMSVIIWGNYTICKLANVIENEDQDNYVQITSYPNLIERVGGKCNKFVKLLGQQCCIGQMQTSIIANLQLIITRFSAVLLVHEYIIHIIVYLAILFILLLVIEPERFAIVGAIMFAVILVIVGAIVAKNMQIISREPHQSDWNYTRWEGIIVSVPCITYIFESSSVILNIRRTMKEPQNLAKVSVWTFTGLGIGIFLIGLSYIFAYGGDDSKRIAFEYYQNKDSPFFSFLFIYCLTNVFTFLLQTSSTEEALADTGLRKIMYGETLKPSRLRVSIIRTLLWTFSALLPMILVDVNAVLGFCGCFFSPACSIAIPAFLVLMYNSDRKMKTSPKYWVWFCIVMVFSLFVLVTGLIHLGYPKLVHPGIERKIRHV